MATKGRHLVMKSEVGPALGLSRQRGYQLIDSDGYRTRAGRRSGFPKPRAYVGLDLEKQRPLWDVAELERWEQRWGLSAS